MGKRCLALLMRWRHKNMGFAHTPAVSFDLAHLFHYDDMKTRNIKVKHSSDRVKLYIFLGRPRTEAVQMPCQKKCLGQKYFTSYFFGIWTNTFCNLKKYIL